MYHLELESTGGIAAVQRFGPDIPLWSCTEKALNGLQLPAPPPGCSQVSVRIATPCRCVEPFAQTGLCARATCPP